MTIGIHTYQQKPSEVQAAIWYPEDPFQRTAVLAWLTNLPIDLEHYEYGEAIGGLHLNFTHVGLYVSPGAYIVYRDGNIVILKPEDFATSYVYAYTVADPDQPELF